MQEYVILKADKAGGCDTEYFCVPCGGNLHFILFVCDDSELPAYFYRGTDDFYKRLCGGMCAGVDIWIAACEDGA